MFKFLLFVFIAVIVFLGGYWLSYNAGEIHLEFLSYEIETTFVWVIASALFAILALYFISKAILFIIRIPLKIADFFRWRHKKYLDKLELDMMLALMEYDENKLYSIAKDLEGNTEKEPLKQVCHILQNINAPKKIELYIDEKALDGNILKFACHTLCSIYENKSEKTKALEACLKLWQVEKKISNFSKIIKLMFQLNKVEEAENFVEATNGMFGHDYLQKDAYRRLKSLLLYYMAIKKVTDEDYKLAIEYLQKSNRLAPEFFLPICALGTLADSGHYKPKSLKFASFSFEEVENAYLTHSIIRSAKYVSGSDFYNFAQNAYDDEKTFESIFLLAKACLANGGYDKAFKLISDLLSNFDKNARVCLLMAEFCERTSGSTSESLQWILDSYDSASKGNYHEMHFDFKEFDFSYTHSNESLHLRIL